MSQLYNKGAFRFRYHGNPTYETTNAQTMAASPTLPCLKGLKSSLMLTAGLRLMTRGPKKGLGVGGYDGQI
jgi:hypothetical protein